MVLVSELEGEGGEKEGERGELGGGEVERMCSGRLNSISGLIMG